MDASLHDGALDRGHIKEETEESLQYGDGIHFEVLVAHEVSGNICGDRLKDYLVILLHVLSEQGDPFVPVFRMVRLVILPML